MRDLISSISSVLAIAPEALNADKTGTAVDLAGFRSASVQIAVGVGGITFTGSNKVEFVLKHSDDDVSYTNVTSDDLVGKPAVTNGIVRSLTAAHTSPTVVEVGYVGGKRYLRLDADFSGTHGAATPISATIVRGHPANAPVV